MIKKGGFSFFSRSNKSKAIINDENTNLIKNENSNTFNNILINRTNNYQPANNSNIR